MKIPRILHRLYAALFGYFWLPCTLCGRERGGHEGKNHSSIMTSWAGGRGVCDNCTDAAKEYNTKWMKDNPHEGYLMR